VVGINHVEELLGARHGVAELRVGGDELGIQLVLALCIVGHIPTSPIRYKDFNSVFAKA